MSRIPLNDDAQEKAKRLQSRHALHDIQMNQIKAAASPMRKLTSFERAGSSSPSSNPKTPRRIAGKENDLDGGVMMVGGTAVTPMKRVPILANFEEWMKMATDNKINATNSWNFALIDYFHDMSLLKEGDGVNFQKASCTLDGCVKIYTSRVDSVATETGKLLSGLADSGNSKKKKGENEEGEESEEEVEDEDGVVRKKPKKRVSCFLFSYFYFVKLYSHTISSVFVFRAYLLLSSSFIRQVDWSGWFTQMEDSRDEYFLGRKRGQNPLFRLRLELALHFGI
jgi:condensin complex subunit 2